MRALFRFSAATCLDSLFVDLDSVAIYSYNFINISGHHHKKVTLLMKTITCPIEVGTNRVTESWYYFKNFRNFITVQEKQWHISSHLIRDKFFYLRLILSTLTHLKVFCFLFTQVISLYGERRRIFDIISIAFRKLI